MMKQVQQDLKAGATDVVDVPVPKVRSGHLLIRTQRSLISAGTERMLVEFGRANLVDKARKQPEKVRQVLDKARTDGLLHTVDAVRSKLAQPITLGYCNAGVVVDVGANVTDFSVGDRVASNGPHAEWVCVPKNLCARIPDDVSDDDAAFTVLGAIALQGIRLVNPTLGEVCVVTGLGLVGLLTVQLLLANGCRVIGIDTDSSRVKLAKSLGAEIIDLSKGEDPTTIAKLATAGHGVDAVIIAAATQSNAPVIQAAEMCRKRGRIVLVGVCGLKLDRRPFFDKEITFQVSCSYGPGRYDPMYEEAGQDYPYSYVRWTEQRNFETLLELMRQKRLALPPLMTHRFAIAEASKAYDLITKSSEKPLGILLDYPPEAQGEELKRTIQLTAPRASADTPRLALIGAGGFTAGVLLPAFAKTSAILKTIASAGGFSAAHLGRRFAFERVTTDANGVLDDASIDAVVIATRHQTHADLVCQALVAGKHVFVEKPLAVSKQELKRIEETISSLSKPPLLMVGFNRRFAPLSLKLKQLLQAQPGPKSLLMTVNAGSIPDDHWAKSTKEGGRIIGEACHFIDLLRYLVGCPIKSTHVDFVFGKRGVIEDMASMSLTFEDGSIGTVHYWSNGHKGFAKERLEVFANGNIAQLDNFRILRGYGFKGFKTTRLLRQDKGHGAETAAFISSITNGSPSPIPLNELLEVTRASFDASPLQT
jgi:predicted dehydrogenase/threonine dehydrogenase-like Zn-dependent dehydrogenase